MEQLIWTNSPNLNIRQASSAALKTSSTKRDTGGQFALFFNRLSAAPENNAMRRAPLFTKQTRNMSEMSDIRASLNSWTDRIANYAMADLI